MYADHEPLGANNYQIQSQLVIQIEIGKGTFALLCYSKTGSMRRRASCSLSLCLCSPGLKSFLDKSGAAERPMRFRNSRTLAGSSLRSFRMSAPPPHMICLSLPYSGHVRRCSTVSFSPQPARHFFFSSTSSTSVMIYFTRQLAASGDLLVLSWWIRTWSARLMLGGRGFGLPAVTLW